MSLKLRALKRTETLLFAGIERFTYLISAVRKQIFFEQFEPRDCDIYICTFLKSGTTWMQMILYQILTDGRMDFEHIYEVSPWLSNEAVLGFDSQKVNDLPSPRIFKSHDPYDRFEPKNSFRFIHVLRDGKDVTLSLMHHRKNYNNSEIDITDTFENYILPVSKYNWFDYNREWLENKYKFNVLYVWYEDLKYDFDNTIERIADFLEVRLNEEIKQRVKERSSFDFMKRHEAKFGEQPKDTRVYDQFIRKGEVGCGQTALSVEQNELFDVYQEKIIKPYQERHHIMKEWRFCNQQLNSTLNLNEVNSSE